MGHVPLFLVKREKLQRFISKAAELDELEEDGASSFSEHCRKHGWALLEWDMDDCEAMMREDMVQTNILGCVGKEQEDDVLLKFLGAGEDCSTSSSSGGSSSVSLRSLLREWQSIFMDAFSLPEQLKSTGTAASSSPTEGIEAIDEIEDNEENKNGAKDLYVVPEGATDPAYRNERGLPVGYRR